MSVTLPDDMIGEPVTSVGKMRVGDSIWVWWNDMAVDTEQQCFLRPEAEARPGGVFNSVIIRVDRKETGYEVWIPAGFKGKWERGRYVGRDYIPVTKLTREPERV